LRERLGNLEIEAGVPWAKLTSKSVADASAIHSLESVEREIRRDHVVAPLDEIGGDENPLFFDFTGNAGRLILRESYKGQEGECVFMLVGLQDRTGVVLLGSGANVIGSSSPRPRFVNPSIDPVGALLVLIDGAPETPGALSWSRAGIARDASDLAPEERVLYSFAAAVEEIKQNSFFQRVRVLAVFTRLIPVQGRSVVNGVGLPEVDQVVLGSPIYVEQIDSSAS
jgi:hypothetical protein